MSKQSHKARRKIKIKKITAKYDEIYKVMARLGGSEDMIMKDQLKKARNRELARLK